MKKYLNNIILVSSMSLLFSCNDRSNLEDNFQTEKDRDISSYQQKTASASTDLSRYPIIFSEDENPNSSELFIENDFTTKEISDDYDWAYFDNFHNRNLNTDEQQYIAYVILKRKDLIGLVAKNEDNIVLVQGLKRNVGILIKNNYIGYHLLYEALSVLKNIDRDFVAQSSRDIANYSEKNRFICEQSVEILSDSNLPEISRTTTELTVANCEYAEIIGQAF